MFATACQSFAQAHEQRNATLPCNIRQLILDDDRLEDLVDLLDLPVDLRRSNAHTAGIERGIAPAMNDHAIVRRDLGPVAMAPHIREMVEVRRLVS